MRYRVSGAHEDLGHEMSCTIEADTQEQAERIARGRGMLVADVIPPDPPARPAPAPPPAMANRGGVSLPVFIASLLAAMGLIYFPLQVKLARTQTQVDNLARRVSRDGESLASLTATVNHNAETANLTAEDLRSLTHTVNVNADALNSLTRVVNYNADVANSNRYIR